MIPESNVGRMLYELILLVMLLYVGTVFPFRLAFHEYRLRESNDIACHVFAEDASWQAWGTVVDWFFYIDLVINFFLTYREGRREIKDPCKIAKNYLCGHFLINLFACLPGDVFSPIVNALGVDPGGCTFGAHGGNDAARLVRLQRATRLVRLARLLRFSGIVSSAQEQMSASLHKIFQRMRFFNMMMCLVWVVHVLACGWYLCAALHVDHSVTWVARRTFGDDGDSLLNEPPFVQWMHSMYFMLTVFTTVGFGDMSALTVGEIFYVMIVMLVGAVVHSIIIGAVIGLVCESSDDEKERQRQKSLLTAFGRQTLMQQSSINKLTKCIDQMEKSDRMEYDRQEMRNLITGGSLPRTLLGELPTQLFKGLLMESQFVTTCASSCYGGAIPPRFTLMLATMLRVQHLKAHQVVFQMHDSASNIYIILAGTFAAIGEPGPNGGLDATVFQAPTVRRQTTSEPSSPRRRGSGDPEDDNSWRVPSTPRTPDSSSSRTPQAASPPNGRKRRDFSSLGLVTTHSSKSTMSDMSITPDSGHHYYSSVSDPNCTSSLHQEGSAWIPYVSDTDQWLEIDMGRSRFVSGVIVAGHPHDDAWVKEFRVLTSTTKGFQKDVSHYVEESKVFEGSFDRATEVEVSFTPRMAQFIRIVPTRWHNSIALRAGVVLSRSTLHPYMVRGRKNYFGDEVLLWSTRTFTMRCEADGEVLLLHRRDLFADGGGLYQEFPQFQRVLLAAARNRHTHRQTMLARLTRGYGHGHSGYRQFAAIHIQRYWRGTSDRRKHGVGRRGASAVGKAASETWSTASMGTNGQNPRAVLGLSMDQKVSGLFNDLHEFRGEVKGKLDKLATSQSELAGQLVAVTAQLQQLVASKQVATQRSPRAAC
jgi:CRP-like cAMP-binding protein